MSSHAATRRLERAGDAELVTLTRKGDTDAYAMLFRRHASAATSVARSVTSTFEPDDLVSEAYTRILQALKAGNGPTAAFRPYLFTTVRNIAASWGRSGKDAVPLEPVELEALAVEADPTLAELDRSLTAQAFRTLPPRWQEALWYSEVEGMQPAELAPLLGVRAQAAAALCYRAREGLRQAWIRAHLNSAHLEPECAWTVERLAARSRGRLGKRDRARVDAHLDTCAKCAMAAAEAEETGSRIALVLLPLVLGSGAAAAYAASVKAGLVVGAGAGGATAAGVGTFGASAAGAQGAGSAGAGASSGSSSGGLSGGAGVLIGVVAGVVVVAGAVAGVLVATAPGHGSDASPAVQQDSFGSSKAGDSSSSPDVSVPGASPSATPAPTADPGRDSSTGPDQTPSTANQNSSSTPASSNPASTPSGTTSSPAAPPTSSPPSSPGTPSTPAPVPPAPPTITADTGDGRYLPVVSGSALPDATVTVSGDGATATVRADASGAWRVTDAFGDFPAGTGTVSASQTDAEGLSSATASVSFSLSAPQLSVTGIGSSHSPLMTVRVTGVPGARIQVLVDGVSQRISSLDGSGQHSYLIALRRGTHDIAVRYADGSGRLGPSTHTTVTVGP